MRFLLLLIDINFRPVGVGRVEEWPQNATNKTGDKNQSSEDEGILQHKYHDISPFKK